MFHSKWHLERTYSTLASNLYMKYSLLYSCPDSKDDLVAIVPKAKKSGFISGEGERFCLAQGVHTGPIIRHLIQWAPSTEVNRP